MKRILFVFLSLCILCSLFVSFLYTTSAAEDVSVTVGQKYEWNDQSATPETQLAWRTGDGKSPDGVWKYQFYAPARDLYQDLVFCYDIAGYAWSSQKDDAAGSLSWARVRSFGVNFHPAVQADIVKTFTAPAGGTITVDVTVARNTDWVQESGTPSSFAVYLEDKLIYPTSGEYLTLSSSVEQKISFDVDVAKNQRLYFRIGCVDGDNGGDAVLMSNTVTYKAVNDDVAEVGSDGTLDFSNISNTVSVTLGEGGNGSGNGGNAGNNGGNGIGRPLENSDSNTGLIIGIVVGVAVVAAAAVVVIMKKKKQQ